MKVYGLTNLQFGVPAGIARNILAAAADLGVSTAEFLRAARGLSYDERGRYGLSVRLPAPDRIGVFGRAGRIVGSLQDLREGRATIDGQESVNPAHRVLPILVDWSDLIGDGPATRLSPSRRKRLPGRRISIKVARAKAALADMAGDPSGAR